ncbi:MAG: hypothetical protein AB2A00_08770 [Myxococcota bacterium]
MNAFASILALLVASQDPDAIERLDGPSRMDALLGNGQLTVGMTPDGEVAVLRWPSPSFYDHLHHVTAHQTHDVHPRDLPRMGAAITDGMFLGVVVDEGNGPVLLPFSDASFSVRTAGYASDISRVARWTAENETIRLTQEALVLADRDVLILRLEVVPRRELRGLSAFLFAHPAPSAHKWEGLPVADFLDDNPDAEEPNGFAILHDDGADALVALTPWPWTRQEARRRALPLALPSSSDTDAATRLLGVLDELSAVALAVGCDRPAELQVGASDEGAGHVLPRDALADLRDGTLDGNGVTLGDGTLALLAPLPTSGTSEVTFYVALANTPSRATAILSDAQRVPAPVLREDTERAAAAILDSVALPDTDEPSARTAALRALISLELMTDVRSGAVVASATTQPALGIDRPTDAALVDVALSRAGRLEAAFRHRRLWAEWQRRSHDGVGPPGSVAGGFYADGELGSAIGFPVDGLALGLWAHGQVVERALTTVELPNPTAPLRALDDAATAALDALLACHDEEAHLPCPADEWYRPTRSQTAWQAAAALVGARQSVWLMGALGDEERQQAAQAYADDIARGLTELLTRGDDEPVPLHALALALGSGGLLQESPTQRLQLLDEALGRARAVLQLQDPGQLMLPLVLWQLLVATRGDPGREEQARSLLDDFVATGPSVFGHVGLASVPVPPTSPGLAGRLEQRAGAPNSAAEAALYLALLERHGRRPPPSLPVPPLGGCGCPGSSDPLGDPSTTLGLALVGWLTRRVKSQRGARGRSFARRVGST